MVPSRLIPMALAFVCAGAVANEAITQANNEFSFIAGGRNLAYHEDAQQQKHGPYLDSETGTVAAFGVTATRQGPLFGVEGLYTSASVIASIGRTDYTGSSIDLAHNGPGIPLAYRDGNVTIDVDARIGKAIAFSSLPSLQLTPFVEYGYHRWYRNKTIGGEVYSNHFAALGALLQYAASSRLVFGVDASAGVTFGASGTGASDKAGKSGLTFELGSRPIVTAGIGADYAIRRNLHLTARYQVRHFAYGASPASLGWYEGMYSRWMEPASKTTDQTLTVGIAYAF